MNASRPVPDQSASDGGIWVGNEVARDSLKQPYKASDGSLYCPDCGGRMIDPRPWQAHDDPLMCNTCEYEWPN